MPKYIERKSEKQSKIFDYAVIYLDRPVKGIKSLSSSLIER